MRQLARPNLVISKCLGFDRCRWNGAVIPDEFVESLKPYAKFQPCPGALMEISDSGKGRKL